MANPTFVLEYESRSCQISNPGDLESCLRHIEYLSRQYEVPIGFYLFKFHDPPSTKNIEAFIYAAVGSEMSPLDYLGDAGFFRVSHEPSESCADFLCGGQLTPVDDTQLVPADLALQLVCKFFRQNGHLDEDFLVCLEGPDVNQEQADRLHGTKHDDDELAVQKRKKLRQK